MWVPVLPWQAQHGWPQLTLAGQIRAEYGTVAERVNYVVLQLVLFSIGATVLWVCGLVRLWRDEAWATYRVLAWTWLFVVVVFALTAGQGYYPAGTYPALVAAGAVVVERWRLRWGLVGLVVVSSLLLVPAALPVLSPTTLARVGVERARRAAARDRRAGRSWSTRSRARTTASPAAQRATAGIVTDNYGEAGAVDRYGPAHGLPEAWSRAQRVRPVGTAPGRRRRPWSCVWEDGAPTPSFTGCRLVGPVVGPVSNEETSRAAVYVCAGPVGGWARDWPRLVHLSS